MARTENILIIVSINKVIYDAKIRNKQFGEYSIFLVKARYISLSAVKNQIHEQYLT